MYLKGKYFNGEITLDKRCYGNGALAVTATDDEGGIMKLSTNVIGISEKLPENQFCFKSWSENEGFYESMLEAKLINPVGVFTTGLCIGKIVQCLF